MSASDLPLHFQSITQVAKQIRSKQISPVELTRAILDRISQLDPKLNSYAHLTADLALDMAQQAEQGIQKGQYLGPLHGIPIAVKDLCFTRNIPTVGGLQVLSDFIPDYDATVITKLKSAGAILLGKLNMTEGAVGGYHRNFPIPKNPWDSNLWTGNSSSGSGVAVSAGLCFGALASDTGGSIRFPAMACGVTGLKPGYGMVSRYGILPLAESLDHVGPMTRTVEDAAIMLDAISGADTNDKTTIKHQIPKSVSQINKNIHGVRIGYDPKYASSGVDHRLVKAVETALEKLKIMGADIIPVQIPWSGEVREIWTTICTYEAVRAHSDYFPARAAEYGEFLNDFLASGLEVDLKTYKEAVTRKEAFNKNFLSAIKGVDLLACPGAGVPSEIPPDLQYGSLKEVRAILNPCSYYQYSIPANFTGLPALSFPCSASATGPPYTLQLVAGNMATATLCQVGYAYQNATDWHRQFPSL